MVLRREALHIMAKYFVWALLTFFVFMLSLCFGQEGASGKPPDITLSPADQLILKSIDKLSDRMDKTGKELSGRIGNLWITMLGGFLGVMAFIGALVFWDRRTFLRRAREGFRAELAQETNKIEGLLAAMKKLGAQFPQVQEALRSFGLL